MPGVLIGEAMAQLGGILLSQKLEPTGKLALLLRWISKDASACGSRDQLLLEQLPCA